MQVMDWSTAQATRADTVGGKGWNLALLARYGFTVPAGGVIAADAYRQFLAQDGLAEPLAAARTLSAEQVGRPDGSAVLLRLREAIRSLPLPADLTAELGRFLADHQLADRPVAVRSSATAEDSARASFAGIHQSLLNVTGPAAIADAARGVYASLWTPQAVAYRRRFGYSDEEVAAAVVIMAMVPAQAAGVGFSCDPKSGRRDRFAISATVGLGEALVSGAIEPDEYLVDMTDYPPRVVHRQIGRKGASAMTLAEALRPALTDEQVVTLSYLIGRVHDALGAMEQPQDVEWVWDGQRFWLVQARPVTRLPVATFPEVAGQPVYWSNANLRDALPGVQSALGWSFFRSNMDTLISGTLNAAGWRYEGGITWCRLYGGRAYFNLTALQWAMYDALGSTPAETNRIMGGHQPEIDVPPTTLLSRLRGKWGQLKVVRTALRTMKAAPAEFQRVSDWAEERLAQDCSGWSKRELLERTTEIKGLMDHFLPFFQVLNGAAGGLHQELVKLLTPVFGERATALANALMAGSGGITSAEHGVRLIGLGNLALEEATTRAWFSESDWAADQWESRLAGTRFESEFRAFLREYGHRGVYEVEPMNPRWNEDPSYLLQAVRSQVLSGRELKLESPEGKRAAAQAEVFGRLRLSPRRLIVAKYAELAARAAGLREMAKSMVVKAAGVSRHYALEIGRRLASEGLIDQRDDLFHLTYMDLWTYLTDQPGVDGFRALVADRKALREQHLAMEPPDVITGEVAEKKAPPPMATGPVLSGLGVAAGTAAGVARVILHPEQGSELLPGEILVAPSTDPAWTPLFLRAAGVVMEIGGHLSHGAIVAREYGLPAVVNIPGLLQAVRTGDRLLVDGDSGKVYRQD